MATAKLIRQGQLKLGVHLELSIEEAKTLLLIFENIGGDPHQSRRKYTDGMYDALEAIGIDYTAEEEAEIVEGPEDHDGIFFRDFPPKPILVRSKVQ